ncbi:MAG: hypothetical protein OSA37_07250 [Flavobacteriales bacterium]|nr:hypothetical protein [Flavobacteriales bacterium]
MRVPFKLQVLLALCRLEFERWRYERNPRAHQRTMWKRFGARTLARSPQYAPDADGSIADFAVQGKVEFMRDFDDINTRGIKLDEAMSVAMDAERCRDFAPTVSGITVGLSSGTSGNRGVFLVSEKERAYWVAMVLQRILGFSLKRRKVAFFLRANSKLYTSVQSRLIQFGFFDLLQPMQNHIARLNSLQPDIVVGQPSLLMMLVEAQHNGQLNILPSRIISVAEVLSPEDQRAIEACFPVTVQQVYQCNEGMFGQSCAHGNIHLNEDGLLIEKDWLDATRFVPIITDMRRMVQPVVRYKMNDILHITECTCGSNMIAISQIEGRTDDVLKFHNERILFPDFIRRAIIGAHPEISNYQIIQESPSKLALFVSPSIHWEAASMALTELFQVQDIADIDIQRLETKRHLLGSKFRRIHAKRH